MLDKVRSRFQNELNKNLRLWNIKIHMGWFYQTDQAGQTYGIFPSNEHPLKNLRQFVHSKNMLHDQACPVFSDPAYKKTPTDFKTKIRFALIKEQLRRLLGAVSKKLLQYPGCLRAGITCGPAKDIRGSDRSCLGNGLII